MATTSLLSCGALATDIEGNDQLSKLIFTPQQHVLIEIESQDIWISILLKLQSPDFKDFEATFDFKIDQSMTGSELKTLIQKFTISIWNQLCKKVITDPGYMQEVKYQMHHSLFLSKDQHMIAPSRLFVLTEFDAYQVRSVENHQEPKSRSKTLGSQASNHSISR